MSVVVHIVGCVGNVINGFQPCQGDTHKQKHTTNDVDTS